MVPNNCILKQGEVFGRFNQSCHPGLATIATFLSCRDIGRAKLVSTIATLTSQVGEVFLPQEVAY
jgi:hypothetical protein